jgi:exodeoxyribonuclease VII small subunit
MSQDQNKLNESTPIAHFERSLEELEQIVIRLEKGELALDDSLSAFERGISLYRQCQGVLDQAQLRVRVLLNPEEPESSTSLDSEAP